MYNCIKLKYFFFVELSTYTCLQLGAFTKFKISRHYIKKNSYILLSKGVMRFLTVVINFYYIVGVIIS